MGMCLPLPLFTVVEKAKRNQYDEPAHVYRLFLPIYMLRESPFKTYATIQMNGGVCRIVFDEKETTHSVSRFYFCSSVWFTPLPARAAYMRRYK